MEPNQQFLKSLSTLSFSCTFSADSAEPPKIRKKSTAAGNGFNLLLLNLKRLNDCGPLKLNLVNRHIFQFSQFLLRSDCCSAAAEEQKQQ